jgi:hypothetical protein
LYYKECEQEEKERRAERDQPKPNERLRDEQDFIVRETGKESIHEIVRINRRRRVTEIPRVHEREQDKKDEHQPRAAEDNRARTRERTGKNNGDDGKQKIKGEAFNVRAVADEQRVRRYDRKRNRKQRKLFFQRARESFDEILLLTIKLALEDGL